MKKRVSIIIIIVMVILVLYFGFGFASKNDVELYWQEKSAEVQHQKQLWEAQKINKYKIGIKIWEWGHDDCAWEVIVENNSLSQTIKSCPKTDFMNISGLFGEIESMLSKHMCGPNGCECDGPYIIDAVYDEQYHFPKTGETAYHPQENWRYRKNSIIDSINPFGKKFCTLLGYAWGIKWDVYTFTPLK